MKNGLYSIHVTLLDGRTGKGSGVILFRDGQILGGDAYLFYTGSYTVKGDTFKGEVLVQRHTSRASTTIRCSAGPARSASASPAPSPTPAATMNGTALVGKASQIFGATLHKLADANSARCHASLQASSTRVLLAFALAIALAETSPLFRRLLQRRHARQIIWIRVPPPGSELRSSRPPSRVVTML